MLKIEINCRICRRVYQPLFADIADTFIQYINTLDLDEIEQLDNDLKANGWGVAKLVMETENSIALLSIFQMFYYHNGRQPLANGLSPAPDGKTPPDSEKISPKSLYEMFKDTKSHGVIFLQLLSVLNIFLDGDIRLSKDTITDLNKNLLLQTLSGQQQIEFEKISDLTSHINFKMKHSIHSNLDRSEKYNVENNEKVKETYEFFKKPNNEEEFEGKIIEDVLPYEHQK